MKKKKNPAASREEVYAIVELEERDLELVVAGFTESLEAKTNYGCAEGCTNNCPDACGG